MPHDRKREDWLDRCTRFLTILGMAMLAMLIVVVAFGLAHLVTR